MTASIRYTLFSHDGQVSPVALLGVVPGVLGGLECVQVGREGEEEEVGGMVGRTGVDGAGAGAESGSFCGAVGALTADSGAVPVIACGSAVPDDGSTAVGVPLELIIPARGPGGTGNGLPEPNSLGLGLTVGGGPAFLPVPLPSIIIDPG